LDILGASLSGASPSWDVASLLAARTAAALPVASGASVPLDPSTGIPIASQTAISLLAVRAMYEWNYQALSALLGTSGAAASFSAESASSIATIEGLLAGMSPATTAASAAYGAGGSSSLLDLLLDYFSPPASALRLVSFGLGSGASDVMASVASAATAATGAAGGTGAPSLILIAMHRAEAYSLRYLDLYSAGTAAGGDSGDGATSSALSMLSIDYASEEDILALYIGPGTDASSGYFPIDLLA
jgi:hypothetical protein